jgi:hypothetical protein
MAAGATGLDDAVAALREALRDGQDDALAVAVLALALALDRRGDGGEARAILADRAPGDPRVALATTRAKDLLAVAPNEAHALEALGLETTDVVGARQAWEQYIAGLAVTPARPWEAHARGHIAGLGSRPVPRRSR